MMVFHSVVIRENLPSERPCIRSKCWLHFFWSGCKSEERREAGVGSAIKTYLFESLEALKPTNHRIRQMKSL